MPDTILSEAEAERIIGLPKRIVGPNQWQQRDDGNWYTEMPVEAEEDLPLRLYSRHNPRTGYFNFILFLGRINLRRLEVGKTHHNPECDNVGTPHKHKWTGRFKDNWAYEPPEISDVDSIGDILAKFLAECNITLDGRFLEPPQAYQRRLI